MFIRYFPNIFHRILSHKNRRPLEKLKAILQKQSILEFISLRLYIQKAYNKTFHVRTLVKKLFKHDTSSVRLFYTRREIKTSKRIKTVINFFNLYID